MFYVEFHFHVCLSALTVHLTLGPSLQLGRWDPQGPPAWPEAVLLWQEQPSSELQEPGPLRHHKVRLTCKFAKASPALFFFFLFSGLSVWDPFSFYLILFFTKPNIFVFPSVGPLDHYLIPGLCLCPPVSAADLSLRCLCFCSLVPDPLLLPSVTTTLLPQAPFFLCLVHRSHLWLHLLRKGLDFAPSLFTLSLTACLLSWKRALVTSKLCVSVQECVAVFACPWPRCLKPCRGLFQQASWAPPFSSCPWPRREPAHVAAPPHRHCWFDIYKRWSIQLVCKKKKEILEECLHEPSVRLWKEWTHL